MYRLLRARASDPVRVAVIGAGKFASMFLAQVRTTPGMRVVGVCDLAPDRAQATLRRSGWNDAEIAALGLFPDADSVLGHGDPEVVVEATGDPVAGVRHALACIAAGRHVVMVNVEADVLAGPLLARRAAEAGTVYSLAYGDQPALIVELVDWARTCGFDVVCAGKGTKYLPAYPRLHAGDRVAALRDQLGARRERRHERQDVQLLPGRHQVRDRDGRGGERDRAASGVRRAVLSAVRKRRAGRDAEAGRRRRNAAARGHGGGDLVSEARRQSGRSATCAGGCT